VLVWANVGTMVLVFARRPHDQFAFLSARRCATSTRLLRRWRADLFFTASYSSAGFAPGRAMLLRSRQFCAPPVARQFVRQYPAIVAQSSATVTVIAMAMASAGLMTLEGAMMTLYGATSAQEPAPTSSPPT
jgi:hypothetical protein